VLGSYAAGRADVYNLTVEGEHEFFANGVLTHNCDALRYLLMAMGLRPPRKPPEALDLSAEARLQRHIDRRLSGRKKSKGRVIGS
jgi:hypothetical protein